MLLTKTKASDAAVTVTVSVPSEIREKTGDAIALTTTTLGLLVILANSGLPDALPDKLVIQADVYRTDAVELLTIVTDADVTDRLSVNDAVTRSRDALSTATVSVPSVRREKTGDATPLLTTVTDADVTARLSEKEAVTSNRLAESMTAVLVPSDRRAKTGQAMALLTTVTEAEDTVRPSVSDAVTKSRLAESTATLSVPSDSRVKTGDAMALVTKTLGELVILAKSGEPDAEPDRLVMQADV